MAVVVDNIEVAFLRSTGKAAAHAIDWSQVSQVPTRSGNSCHKVVGDDGQPMEKAQQSCWRWKPRSRKVTENVGTLQKFEKWLSGT